MKLTPFAKSLATLTILRKKSPLAFSLTGTPGGSLFWMRMRQAIASGSKAAVGLAVAISFDPGGGNTSTTACSTSSSEVESLKPAK
jgi:hypothetical protein